MKFSTVAILGGLSLFEGALAFKAPKRPVVKSWPLSPKEPIPESPARDKCRFCVVPGGKEDDSPDILAAAHECNDGGTVVFKPDTDYVLGSPLDLTFLKHIDFAILGTIRPKPDVAYWTEHAFRYHFQDVHAFWRFGGEDVNIYGNNQGELDGLGQTWWNAKKENHTVVRPILFATDGLDGGSMSGLLMNNSGFWFNVIMNTNNFIVDDMVLDISVANRSSPSSNTDGWDTYRSSNIVIQNSLIDNGDDCVSFKPNSTNILVQNLICSGSHGMSVGSLGQYQDEIDIVENVYVYNISMSWASNCARIKIWPGVPPGTEHSTSGGGGGYVKNVTWDTCHNFENEFIVEMSQCYFAQSLELCKEYPATLVMEDITFKNFYGTSNDDWDPIVGTLTCSSPDVCKNIRAMNMTVDTPSGQPAQWVCQGIPWDQLEVNCQEPPPGWGHW